VHQAGAIAAFGLLIDGFRQRGGDA
jgi:hypothetical protein